MWVTALFFDKPGLIHDSGASAWPRVRGSRGREWLHRELSPAQTLQDLHSQVEAVSFSHRRWAVLQIWLSTSMIKYHLFNIKDAVYSCMSKEEFLLPAYCYSAPSLRLLLFVTLLCALFFSHVLFITWALLSFAHCFYYPGINLQRHRGNTCSFL